MSIRGEERFGSFIVIVALIWGVHMAMTRLSAGNGLELPQIPLEVAAIGVLIWLHAKWRRSITAK
jgi:hypothetical protein